MIEFNWNSSVRSALRPTTDLAFGFLQSRTKQSSFQFVTRIRAPTDENFLERSRGDDGFTRTTTPTLPMKVGRVDSMFLDVAMHRCIVSSRGHQSERDKDLPNASGFGDRVAQFSQCPPFLLSGHSTDSSHTKCSMEHARGWHIHRDFRIDRIHRPVTTIFKQKEPTEGVGSAHVDGSARHSHQRIRAERLLEDVQSNNAVHGLRRDDRASPNASQNSMGRPASWTMRPPYTKRCA